MLKNENRLKNERDFERVYKKGGFAQGKYLKLNLLENKARRQRASVVVSKKLEKSAVKRNRIKRVYREVLKVFLADLDKNYDLVLTPKKESFDVPLEELKEDFSNILKKAGALK